SATAWAAAARGAELAPLDDEFAALLGQSHECGQRPPHPAGHGGPLVLDGWAEDHVQPVVPMENVDCPVKLWNVATTVVSTRADPLSVAPIMTTEVVAPGAAPVAPVIPVAPVMPVAPVAPTPV